MRALGRALVWASALATACGPGASGADVFTDSSADATSEGGASSDSGTSESGAAAATTLTATFNGVTRTFDRAQFGFGLVSAAPGREVYVESYAGGDPACPTMTSRTPDRTMVLAGVRVPAEHTPLTTADGLSLSLLDFQGDLSSSPAPQRATAVRVTVHEALLSPAESASVDLEIEGDFAGGATVRGRVRATHCNSLDE